MKQHVKDQILRRAISLISRFGMDAVGIPQINSEADLEGICIYDYFKSMDDISDHILLFMYDELIFYTPSTKDVAIMLKDQPPEAILRRFYTYYDEKAGPLWQELYRILYMQMYRDKRFWQAADRLIVKGPMEALENTLRYMMEASAIPPGDSRSLAELWTRTSILFSIQNANDPTPMDREEYNGMQSFFIQIALRGVTPVPVRQLSSRHRLPLQASREQPRKDKDSILLSALELYARFGYNNVPMREIATHAGINLGSVYRLFRSKELIMKSLVDRFLSDYTAYLSDELRLCALFCSGGSTQDALSPSSPCPPALANRAHSMYQVLFREYFIDDQLEEFFFSSIGRDRSAIIRLLKQLAADKQIPPCDTAHIATAYIYTMIFLTLDSAVDDFIADINSSRLSATALLVGLIVNGYDYLPGKWYATSQVQ